ncbi:MAG: leucine-rich repeat domain-containing protein, partial [Clostridia bacterium]|nr:leucine-rich repeat domain-containing protein [Clostridia bacterium]
MRKFTNKFLAILMCLTMMLTIAPLSGIVPLVSAATYSGSCGTNLTWTLNTSTGMLEITGEGDMTDWSSADYVPWYSYTEDIKIVNIGDGVSNIGYCAFEDCSNLTNIIIPDSVTSIGDRAFCRCTNLTNITMSTTVTVIGDYAFRNCTNLTSIIIPVSVTNIGYSAFGFCNNLKDIYYCGTEEDWGKISIDSNNTIITNATLHYNHHLHSYVPSITKDSTCTEKGTKTYFCDCGDSYEEKIDLAKHNYENGACTKCGCKGYSGESADGRLVWSLDIENGILDVKGILDERPWHPYKDYIKIVNILEGTTTISPSAFEDYAN